MNIKIERITETDFERLICLFQEFALFEKMPHKMTNTVEQMKKEKNYFDGLVIKDDTNNILGYATFFFAYYTWTGKSLYMDDLYIRPKYRGKGFGSKLINEIISLARINKCYKVRWQVSNWNKSAIQFYKKIGAQIDNIENNCDLLL